MTTMAILGENNQALARPLKTSKPTDAAVLPAKLPTATVPEDIDVTALATEVIGVLPSLPADRLISDAIWRDSCSLTNTFRTLYSAEHVFEAWKELGNLYHPSNFALDPQSISVAHIGPDSAWLEAGFTFNTSGSGPIMDCYGIVHIILDDAGQWKIWIVRTMLENYRGYGDVDNLEPVSKSLTNGHSSQNGDVTAKRLFKHYDCIVIGGGQAGLNVGGRLQTLGVKYLVIEKDPKIGDSWGNRYDSAKCECQNDVSLSGLAY